MRVFTETGEETTGLFGGVPPQGEWGCSFAARPGCLQAGPPQGDQEGDQQDEGGYY